MSRTAFCAVCALAILALLLVPTRALAHETLTAGEYSIEFGWLSEPPVTGQPNGFEINISSNAAAHSHTDTAPMVTITSPVDGGEVGSDGFEVTVGIEGADAASQHWHLYADDQLLEMLPIDTTSHMVMGLTAGTHTIEAMVVDNNHNPVGESSTVTVNVVAGATASTGAGESTTHTHAAASEEIDVSQLKVEVSYGGQVQALELVPAGEDTPGRYIARLTPTRAGQYTVRFSGKLGDTDVSAEVQPDEVVQSDPNAFPETAVSVSDLVTRLGAAEAALGTARSLAVASLVIGLLGLIVGAAALVRKK